MPTDLSKLLAQWKKTPAQALADAIVALDQAPPFEGTTEEWVDAARKAKEIERSRFLGSIVGSVSPSSGSSDSMEAAF